MVSPLARPIRTAISTIPSAPLVLIDVTTREGIVGSALIYSAYTPAALSALCRLVVDIGAELIGQPVAPEQNVLRRFDRRFRLLGWQGLVGMAVLGLDMALWDALGRAAENQSRKSWAARYVRSKLTTASASSMEIDAEVLAASVASGFKAIKIKIGDGDLARDVAAVRSVREIVGSDVRLMVDFNQSLDVPEAVHRIQRLSDFDLHWVESWSRLRISQVMHGSARQRARRSRPARIGGFRQAWRRQLL